MKIFWNSEFFISFLYFITKWKLYVEMDCPNFIKSHKTCLDLFLSHCQAF